MRILSTLVVVMSISYGSYAEEGSSAVEMSPTAGQRASARIELLSAVPLSQRIVIPAAGTKLAQLVVFTDMDCPYCMQLHRIREAIAQRGIEIHYLFYPRAGPSGESYSQAVAVWCSADRLEALGKVLLGEGLPAADCENPVMAHYELAMKLGLMGTPAIVTSDGVLGYGIPDID